MTVLRTKINYTFKKTKHLERVNGNTKRTVKISFIVKKNSKYLIALTKNFTWNKKPSFKTFNIRT